MKTLQTVIFLNYLENLSVLRFKPRAKAFLVTAVIHRWLIFSVLSPEMIAKRNSMPEMCAV